MLHGAAGEIGVDHRDHEQGEQRPDQEPADNDPANILAALGACSGRESKRYRAKHHGACGHQDRPQPERGGLDDGLADRVALCAELIGELDDQNAVLG